METKLEIVSGDHGYYPKMDFFQTARAYCFQLDTPGLGTEDVAVNVTEGNILQISGERSTGEINGVYHIKERGSGKFLRQHKLPGSVKLNQIEASLHRGVLTVIVPKEDWKVNPIGVFDESVMFENGYAVYKSLERSQAGHVFEPTKEKGGLTVPEKFNAVLEDYKPRMFENGGVTFESVLEKFTAMLEDVVPVKDGDKDKTVLDDVVRIKSAADKGKAVMEEPVKDIKCMKSSGESSRQLKIAEKDWSKIKF